MTKTKLDPAHLGAIDEALLDFIRGAYDAWRGRRAVAPSSKEPSLTVGVLKGFVDQHRIGDDDPVMAEFGTRYSHKTNRERYRIVQSALDRLRRKKLIGRSLGVGDHGKAAHC